MRPIMDTTQNTVTFSKKSIEHLEELIEGLIISRERKFTPIRRKNSKIALMSHKMPKGLSSTSTFRTFELINDMKKQTGLVLDETKPIVIFGCHPGGDF
jgi:hypothetical protein